MVEIEHIPWIAMAGLLLFIVAAFTPLFGELSAAIPRWLGRYPQIWENDSRVLWAECDAAGQLGAFVYDGEERVYSGMGHRRKHWIRGWRRGRGIVWERRAELIRSDVVAAVSGVVVYLRSEGKLCAVDATSGAARWEVALPIVQIEPVVVRAGTLLYTGHDPHNNNEPAWLKLSAADGTTLAHGRGKPEPSEPEAERGPEAERRDDWAEPRRCELVRLPDNTRRAGELESVLRLRGQGASGLQQALGPAHPESVIEAARQLGAACYAVRISHVQRPPETQCVTLLVDVARSTVLADLAQSGAWVLAADGKRQAVRV